MFLEVRRYQAAGVPEVMAPEWVVAYEAQGEDAAGEEGVGFCSGSWRGWVIVCGLREEVEGLGLGVWVCGRHREEGMMWWEVEMNHVATVGELFLEFVLVYE